MWWVEGWLRWVVTGCGGWKLGGSWLGWVETGCGGWRLVVVGGDAIGGGLVGRWCTGRLVGWWGTGRLVGWAPLTVEIIP